MIDYKLDDLGWSEFEHLIQTVVKARLGFGVEAWGGRGDWGCDAYFAGKLRYPGNEETDGPFVFQCKFVENANAAGAKPEKLLIGAVQKECAKIRKNLKSGKWTKAPNCYGLFTNAPCTPALRESLRASLSKALPGAHIAIHDGGDVCQWLRLSPEIMESFPQLRSTPKPILTLHQLPPVPAAFTGREQELRDLETALGKQGNIGAAISASGAGIQGMGGVGKTALATILAHRLKDKYPDAQICLNLRGVEPKPMQPVEAMQSIIHAFQPEAKLPESVEELAPIYNTVLNDAGRVLLFLDNAANAEQIKPLLPPSNCLLLVTSRNQFSLPGLTTRNIDCLPPEKSRELLLKLVPRLKGHETDAADLCGHLPLALEVFAGLVSEKTLHPVEELVARLRRQDEKLGKVEAAFQVSYDLLEEPLRRCWTLLGIFPASFDLPAAAAIWETKTVAARDIMESLLKWSLVEADEAKVRFRLHDLVRQFCNGKLNDAERDVAMMLYGGYYTKIGWESQELYLKGGENVVQGLALFDRELAHIEAAFEWLAPRRDEASATLLISLVNAIVHASDLRFHPRQSIRWLEGQREAARTTKNRRSESGALGNLGVAYVKLGEPRKGIGFFEQSLVIDREIGDRRSEGLVLGNLGNAYFYLSEPRKAVEFHSQQLVIAREVGDQKSEGSALGNLGNVHIVLSEPRKAIEFYQQALAISRELGDRRAEGLLLGNLGNAYNDLGEPRKSIEFSMQRLVIAREIGDRRGEGSALGNLGIAYANMGDSRKAINFFEQHLVITRESGDRNGEGKALGNLGIAYAHLEELRKAIEFYERALVIGCEIGDRQGESTDLGNLGLAYAHLGELRKAIEFYEQALVIDCEIGDRQGESADLGNIGLAYANLGEPRKAIEFYEQQLVITREIGYRHGEGNALFNSALVLDELNDRAQAIARAEAALQIFETIEDPGTAQVRAQLEKWKGDRGK
jgi:tetratricopeptide (TPR) repeat protein